MCTGLELFLIGATTVSAVAQVQRGQQQKKMANFQAAQADADAHAEVEAGQVRADKVRKQLKAARGAAATDFAASGVKIGTGTPLVIDQEIVDDNEENALQEILYGSRKGTRLEQEASGLRLAGKNAEREGFMGAAGSVLSGGAQYYGGGWKRVRAEQSPAPVEDRVLR